MFHSDKQRNQRPKKWFECERQRNQRESIGFMFVVAKESAEKHGFIMAFHFENKNFDSHGGRTVQKTKNIKKHCFIYKMVRDTPAHGFDGRDPITCCLAAP